MAHILHCDTCTCTLIQLCFFPLLYTCCCFSVAPSLNSLWCSFVVLPILPAILPGNALLALYQSHHDHGQANVSSLTARLPVLPVSFSLYVSPDCCFVCIFLVVVCAHTFALHHSSSPSRSPSHSPSLGHPWSAVLYWECSEHVQLRQCDHMHHAHAHCVQPRHTDTQLSAFLLKEQMWGKLPKACTTTRHNWKAWEIKAWFVVLGALSTNGRIKRSTVQHRLSGPCLSGTSIVRTSWRPENTLPCMHKRHGQWSFVGVVTGWVMSYGLYFGQNWLTRVLFITAGHDHTA